MILSAEDRFEWQNAITVTRVSTNTIDLLAANRDIGQLESLFLFGKVDEAFTASGSATLACDLIQSTAAALTSPDTLCPIIAATGKATLVLDYVMFRFKIPIGLINKRYIGLNWTVATGPMTAGKVSALLTPEVDANRAYPQGYVNF